MMMMRKILGKNYFRDSDVNLGFYSKKREGVSDVDPKVNFASVSLILNFRLWNLLSRYLVNLHEKSLLIDKESFLPL